MRCRIKFRPAALKAMQKTPTRKVLRLMTVISALAATPRPPECVRLPGREGFCVLRVDDRRIIYMLKGGTLLVCAVCPAHAGEEDL